MAPVGRLLLVHRISRRLLSSSSSASRPPPVVVNPKTLNSLFHEPNLDLFLTRFHRLSATYQLPTSIYAVAVRRLATAGRSAEAANLLDSLKESLSPELPSNESLSASLISLYSKAGLPDRALEAFHHLLPSLGAPRTVRSFNALLSALSKHDPDRAVREFESIPLSDPEIKLDVASYSMLVRVLCEKGDLDGAAACLHVMEEKGVEPNDVTYNTLLNALYKSDRAEEAESIWGKMEEKGCGPNIRSYNAKMRWLVTKGRTVEAADLLRRMMLESSNSNSTGGVMPDGYSFTALIVAHCKDGNLKEGKRMLDELRRNKCEPTPWTYEALVPRMCEEGELDSALSLCRESLRKRCCVGVQVLQGVVDRLVTASRVGDARKLIETAWSTHYYSKESLIMPPECLALIESEEQEKMLKETQGRDESAKGNLVLRKVSTDEGEGLQDKSMSSGASCKIGIIVKSFDKPKYMGAFGVPPDKNRVKLPTTRTLITVLRSPHVHKKSREQFDMKVRREYIVIKCQPHELNKKYFWFKRARVLGAQFELVFSYRTRLDMSRLKQSV